MFGMFNPLGFLQSYGLLIVGMAAAVLLFSKNIEIDNLKAELEISTLQVEKMKSDKENMRTQLDMCVTEISKVNEQMEHLAADRNRALDKFNEQKAKPPEVRYEVVYKHIINKDGSNDCNDVKGVLDSVRSLEPKRL